MNEIKKVLERRSERDYKNAPIEKEKIDQIINVINSAPTSTNSQDFSAIIVDDQQLRLEISQNLPTQKHIVNAPLFIIFCADMNRINYVAQQTQKTIYTNSINSFLTSAGDAFIAASFAVNAAIQLGLGTCYIGMVRGKLKEIQKALNLEGTIVPVVGLTIGYIATQQEIKPKINHVYISKYNLNQLHNEVDKYDLEMLNYYDTRSQNRTHNKWSQTCLNFFLQPSPLTSEIDAFIKNVWKIQ